MFTQATVTYVMNTHHVGGSDVDGVLTITFSDVIATIGGTNHHAEGHLWEAPVNTVSRRHGMLLICAYNKHTIPD